MKPEYEDPVEMQSGRLWASVCEIEPLVRSASRFCAQQPTSEAMLLGDLFRLMQRVGIATGDETCHLSKRPLASGTTDFVVGTLAGASDLEDAMRRVARAYNSIHGGNFNRVERRHDRIVYVIDDRDFPYAVEPASGYAYAMLESVLIFLHAILSLAVDADLVPALRGVSTRRPVRGEQDGLLAFWPVRARCGSEVYALDYELAAARRPVRADLANVAGSAHVYETISAMIAARERSGRVSDFPARVAAALASGAVEQRQVARLLGVSVATLRRRLGSAPSGFRGLRADALNLQARSFLTHCGHIGTVAERLGFSDARSFSRAFKAWNGITPASFLQSRPAIARDGPA